MFKAIHKETGELISAFKLTKDTKWVGKEREEFISPRPEIFNFKELEKKGIKEVPVSYVKSHERNYKNYKRLVSPHFRIELKEAIPNLESESYEHKIAKEGIYEEIYFDNLLIEGKKISDLGIIKEIDIEHHLSPTKKSKIVDVYLEFEKEHKLYGKGIVFEIQFSSQNKYLTEERTYDRILKGYSVIWLWENSFDKNYNLINKNLPITPFIQALKEYELIAEDNYKNKLNKLSSIYENKIKESKDYLDICLEDFKINTKRIMDFIKEYESKVYERKENLDRKEKTFKEDIAILSSEQESKLKQKYQIIQEEQLKTINKIYQKIKEDFSNDEKLKEIILSSINYEELSQRIYKKSEEKLIKSILFNIEKKHNLNELKNLAEKELFKNIKEIIIPKLEGQFNILNGFAMFKCSKCKNNKRVSAARVDNELGLICGTCYFQEKSIKDSNWYKRYKEEREMNEKRFNKNKNN